MSEPIAYMGYQWITIDDGIITIGISEEAAEDLTGELTLSLPSEEDAVAPNKVCGDIESANGNLNLYSPVEGLVVEVNEQVIDDPQILLDDPSDEGWLFKVEADDPDSIDQVSLRALGSDDDDADDDEASLGDAGFGEVEDDD